MANLFRLLMAVLLVGALAIGGANAATFYVNHGSAGGDGTTPATSGAHAAFTHLQDCVTSRVAANADLTNDGAGVIEEWICDGSTADSNYVHLIGFTTDADNYIYIHTPSNSRHSGKWDDTKYRIVSSEYYGLSIGVNYVRIDGLQISHIDPVSVGRHAVTIEGTFANGANDIRISNTIIKGHNHATYWEYGINVGSSDYVNLKLWNVLVYNVRPLIDSCGIYFDFGPTVSMYNCVVIGGNRSVSRAFGTIIAKNCYVGGSLNADYFGTITKTTCASSDATATGTGNIPNVAVSTSSGAYFTNVTAGYEDFHLASSSSALWHTGTDTSGDTAPLNFLTDINGDTFASPRSIGVDEFFADAMATTFNRRTRARV